MGSARPAVSRPGWGREAPRGSGLSWREAPVTPEGGGPRGYYLAHIMWKSLFHMPLRPLPLTKLVALRLYASVTQGEAVSFSLMV